MKKIKEDIECRLTCRECGAEATVSEDSVYVRYAGVQYFCPGKDCEDIFASKL